MSSRADTILRLARASKESSDGIVRHLYRDALEREAMTRAVDVVRADAARGVRHTHSSALQIYAGGMRDLASHYRRRLKLDGESYYNALEHL